ARVELALLGPHRLDGSELVRRERLRHLGALGCRRRPDDRRPARHHRQRTVERDDQLGRRRHPPLVGCDAHRRQLHADELGSTSPVVLDPGDLAQGGKDGKIRVISVAAMNGTAPHKGGELQIVSTPSGTDLFTAPAVWHSGSTTWFFAADNGGTAAWTYSNGHLTQAWQHATG